MSVAGPKRRRRPSREKSRPSVFWLLGGIVVPLVGYLAKIEIEGEEHLPEDGPFVLAPNHYSEVDPLIVAVAVWRLGRAPRFLAKDSLFRIPVLGWALRSTGMVPVARAGHAGSTQTLEAAEQLSRIGGGVVVYPEGTLTRDPGMWPMRGKTGAVRIAIDGDIPLLPVAHWGAQQIMPRYGRLRIWPPRRRVRVLFGPAIELPPEARERSASAHSAATTILMDRVADLLGELRGEQPPAHRWDPAAHQQKETGRFES